MNRIRCISISHKEAPIQTRERIRVDYEHLMPLMSNQSEVYVLNTCNRTEVYWTAMDFPRIIGLVSGMSGMDRDDLCGISRSMEGWDAIRHLFMVASGLESQVIGEPQILGQVKDAYREALKYNTVSTLINKAMHRTFRTAKRIRTETGIGRNPVSIASEAVELSAHIFGDISKSSVLVIGAGDMAAIAAKRLKDRGVKRLCILNRTYEKACELSGQLGGDPRPFSHLEDELVSCDIIISSTGASRPIIDRVMMGTVMKRRRNKPVIIVDIALPRDVDPAVKGLDNCYLYDLDALESIVERHSSDRGQEMARAMEIIDHEVDVFEKWTRSLNAQDTITELMGLIDSHV
ncbi:MAG: glutamyl-tRNA reductase, partial [Thermodesulfobacteriota bacterium]|nr:glutamyl-tRNA reductase [Thermodesulfobacteriota bacterium]